MCIICNALHCIHLQATGQCHDMTDRCQQLYLPDCPDMTEPHRDVMMKTSVTPDLWKVCVHWAALTLLLVA